MHGAPDTELERLLSGSLKQSVSVKLRLLELHAQTIIRWARWITESMVQGNKLIVFGNGGSAADAQHIAAEFLGRYDCERKPLPALALASNSSVLTAISNDFGFENIFARQLEALGRNGDIALAISTSGNSGNVILGAKAARECGMKVLVLTGEHPGPLVTHADSVLDVPSNNVARIQECHITIAHLLCELVDSILNCG
ncbi:MAG TPA: SIS domain-containing protein [Candidatus Angelobacter sp.]|jgi:D-sedoheptulose 7-phosphate isomerase|nr:SIS domain-containing protein [Candidatus Angelobacter sp.]